MIHNRIRFRHLNCFLAIAQHHSVGTAAEKLAITQPALSKTLRELEEALGVRLFERDRRGMILNRFGAIFLQHAAASIGSLRNGVDSIDVARTESNHFVTVGALPNVAACLMPLAVRIFKQNTAGLTVRVVTGSNSRLLDQLRLGELELVVGRLAKSEHMTGLSFEHMYAESLTIAVRPNHPFAIDPGFALPMLSDTAWILPDHGTIIRQEVDRFLLAEGIAKSSDIIESTSVAFGRGYSDALDVAWFVPRGVVKGDIDAGRLVELPTPRGAMEGPVGVTTRADVDPAPADRLMIKAVRDAARSLL
jgi:LysR family pca operon transcriptional activator